MTDKKRHYLILVASLIVCAFVDIDEYALPLNTTNEIVTDVINVPHWGKSGSYNTYYIQTIKHKYNIAPALYDYINTGDKVSVFRSFITHSAQKISLTKGSETYISDTGFVEKNFALAFTVLNAAGILFFLIFYEYVKNIQGRSNLAYFFVALSVLVLLFHLW